MRDSAALRGDGAYAGACCGVRAEVALAGTHWFLAAYSIHEVDAGVCYATGCNNRTKNLPLAGGWGARAGRAWPHSYACSPAGMALLVQSIQVV